MSGRLQGKIAIVVGAGQSAGETIGNGRAMAVLFARHGTAARKMKIPFAPFLALGGLVALFAGDPLVDAYLTLLH